MVAREAKRRRKQRQESHEEANGTINTQYCMVQSMLQELPNELMPEILQYLCAGTLSQMKELNTAWKEACTIAINIKWTAGTKKVFRTAQELRYAVRKYTAHTFEDVDDFATTYGYPINKWDVSRLEDFSYLLFWCQKHFKEDISRWNVSRAINMRAMFGGASAFNQDIASWNTLNLTNMAYMFDNT